MGLTQAAWGSATLQARHARAHGGATQGGSHHQRLALSVRRQEKALLEPIACGPATHLAREHVQAGDMTLHRAGTPGQAHPGSERLIVVAPPLRTPLQGHEGTCRRPGQPRVQLVQLACTHEPCAVLGSRDGGSHLRGLGLPRGKLGGLIRIPPRWPP